MYSFFVDLAHIVRAKETALQVKVTVNVGIHINGEEVATDCGRQYGRSALIYGYTSVLQALLIVVQPGCHVRSGFKEVSLASCGISQPSQV